MGFAPGPGQSSTSPSANATVTAAPPNSPEVTIVGWVDGNAPDIVDAVNTGPTTPALKSNLTGGFYSCTNELLNWYEGNPVDLVTAQDRAYANAWALQNSANPLPPDNIDPKAEYNSGNWRLFNDFGVGKSTVAVGTTPFPCFGGTATWFDPAGESNANMGASNTTAAGNTYLLAEGRVGKAGQKINSTVNNLDTPWIWSVIEFDPSGMQISNSSGLSVFPTFDVYVNGVWQNEIKQHSAQFFIDLGGSYEIQPSDIQ